AHPLAHLRPPGHWLGPARFGPDRSPAVARTRSAGPRPGPAPGWPTASPGSCRALADRLRPTPTRSAAASPPRHRRLVPGYRARTRDGPPAPAAPRPPGPGSRPATRPVRLADAPPRSLVDAQRGVHRAAEPAIPAGIALAGRPQVPAVEVRPRGVDEHQLGVGRLPEQEVGRPLLAGGPQEQVHVRQARLVQVAGEGLLIDLGRVEPAGRGKLGQLPGGVHHLGPAAVVDTELQGEPVIADG